MSVQENITAADDAARRPMRRYARNGRSRSAAPMKLLKRLWIEEEGQDLTEYALLLVLLTLAAIGSLSTLAVAVNSVFARASTNLNPT